jgi:hypothetical protein
LTGDFFSGLRGCLDAHRKTLKNRVKVQFNRNAEAELEQNALINSVGTIRGNVVVGTSAWRVSTRLCQSSRPCVIGCERH